MTIDQIPQLAAAVITLGAVSYATNLLWVHVLRPLYRAVIYISEFMEAYPAIISAAREFEDGGRETLRGQVRSIDGRLHNIEGQLEALITNHR